MKYNLAGQKYPHFTILESVHKDYKGKKILYWKCKCECGNIFYARTHDIITEKIKSCGCYQKKYQRDKHLGTGKIKIGDKFGLLEVVNTEIGKDRRMQYVCRCKCGNYITLSGSHLAKRYSCGCLTGGYLPESNIKAESFIHLGKKSKRNTSGCPGVYWKKDKQKWQASIYFNGKNHHIGYFNDKEKAVQARKEAEEELYKKYSKYIDQMPNKNNAYTSDL